MLALESLGVRLGVRIYFKIIQNYSIRSKFEKRKTPMREKGLKSFKVPP